MEQSRDRGSAAKSVGSHRRGDWSKSIIAMLHDFTIVTEETTLETWNSTLFSGVLLTWENYVL